jgi:hypothetical protein
MVVFQIISHPYCYYKAYIDPQIPPALFTLKMVAAVSPVFNSTEIN